MSASSGFCTRIDLRVQDEAATARVARSVARVAAPGDVIGLTGDLGSGKTSFARAFIRSRTRPDEDVPSPTFTLVQGYDADGMTISHVDLYRLDDPEDIWELGLEDAIADGITLVEWPDRLGALRPALGLDVAMAVVPGGVETARTVTVRGGPSWRSRIRDLEKELAAYRHG